MCRKVHGKPLVTALHSPSLSNTFVGGHYGKNYIVIIEAGWLNKSNWHLSRKDTKAVAAAKGNSAGRNHETGRKIAEICQYYNIPHMLVRPLKKMWKGRDGKITREEIAAFTGITGRNNQEARDALLLAWEYAGLPVRKTP